MLWEEVQSAMDGGFMSWIGLLFWCIVRIKRHNIHWFTVSLNKMYKLYLSAHAFIMWLVAKSLYHSRISDFKEHGLCFTFSGCCTSSCCSPTIVRSILNRVLLGSIALFVDILKCLFVYQNTNKIGTRNDGNTTLGIILQSQSKVPGSNPWILNFFHLTDLSFVLALLNPFVIYWSTLPALQNWLNATHWQSLPPVTTAFR